MARVTIKLHGKIAEHYPHDIVLEATTIREAITGMTMIDAFNPAKNTKRFVCTVDECPVADKLDEPIENNILNLHCEQVHENSVIQGAGNNPYVNIIIGIVLIIVGFFTYQSTTKEGVMMLGVGIASLGASLVIGGIMQIVNPVDALETEKEERNNSVTSYLNTVASGTTIPIILGKHKHAGHLFSLNTESRSAKNVNLSGLVSELPEFEGTWVTMHSQLSEDVYNEYPPGGGGGGGAGGGRWDILTLQK